MDKCNECVAKRYCFKYREDGECTNPAFNGTMQLKKKRTRTKKNKLVWRKCHAGYKFPSDAIVIPQDERTTDTDPRLVRCAVWDSIYILVSDLKKLPIEKKYGKKFW